MAPNHKVKTILQAFFVSLVQVQLVDGAATQINTTICTWEAPRGIISPTIHRHKKTANGGQAAIIHDKIFLDGGDISWLPGLDDGSYGPPSGINSTHNIHVSLYWPSSSYADSHLLGGVSDVLLTYNLSYAFTSNTNVTGLLLQDLLSKAVGGTGQSDIGAVSYVDGALLANNAEFWFYGGQPGIQSEALPDKNSVDGYEDFQYGYTSSNFHSGFVSNRELPGNVSQFITFGGAARAPSENLAWYFSGATSESGGLIPKSSNATNRPSKISNYLITLDMSDQRFETWNNQTLPPNIKGRASAEVVWVPVGVQGILVALGGVVFPEYAGKNRVSQNPTASVRNASKCSPVQV